MTHDIAQVLAWDSNFFGKRIAQAEDHQLDPTLAHDLDSWCLDHNIDCLYFLADSNHQDTVALLEKNHYQFMDIRITFETKRKPIDQPIPPHITIRLSQDTDLEHLISISQDAYTSSRFYADPCFSDTAASDLYRLWIKNSMETNFADAVIVAEINQLPVGFVTCKIDQPQHQGRIGLVGVAESARGNQLGQHMMNYALNWFNEQDISRIYVGTQGRNIAAQRLYQRSGFLTHSVQLWYHKWFTNCSP